MAEADERRGRGLRLRQTRKDAGLTLRKAAEKTGISFETLRAHETGRNGFNPTYARIYAREYGTTEQHLLYDQNHVSLAESDLAREFAKLAPGERKRWSEVFVQMLRVAKGLD